MQKITVFIWQGNSKTPKNDKPFALETACKWLAFFAERCYNTLGYGWMALTECQTLCKKVSFYISRMGGKYILRHFLKGFKLWQKSMKGGAAWLRREPRNR